MNVLAFDIETVPDVDAGRSLYALNGLDDADVIKAMSQLRRQKSGSDFMPLHLHRIVAISVTLQTDDDVKVWSLGEPGSSEAELIERFFDGLDRYEPVLVSWNGNGFDLPVLAYRALVHGVNASPYWEAGDGRREYKFNNYFNRFHTRHTDVMDVLSHFNLRGAAPLDEVAQMLGFPGKLGMHGSKVAEAWLDGDIETIRNYCETDTLNTYLVWLRFEQVRGHSSARACEEKMRALKARLETDGRAHLGEFARQWVHEPDARSSR